MVARFAKIPPEYTFLCSQEWDEINICPLNCPDSKASQNYYEPQIIFMRSREIFFNALWEI